MARELHHIEITFTVRDYEHLPAKNGRQMYADDVRAELRAAVQAAVTGWYQDRGHELLVDEPYV